MNVNILTIGQLIYETNMTDSESVDRRSVRGHTKLYIQSPYRSFSYLNVLFLAVAVVLPAVFLLLSPVSILDLLSRTNATDSTSDRSYPLKVIALPELQIRMKSFLMRNSAADKPMNNEFVIASRSFTTQSDGSSHYLNLLTVLLSNI